MKARQILLPFYYSICNKKMHNVKIDCENSIRIEESSRINIKGIEILIPKV
jgi:hypothetical protein